jgi:hypothetical protein
MINLAFNCDACNNIVIIEDTYIYTVNDEYVSCVCVECTKKFNVKLEKIFSNSVI